MRDKAAGGNTEERRNGERIHTQGVIPALLGRGDALIIDLSKNGVRVRHGHPVRCGGTVRLAFTWQDTRFSFSAVVLASRFVRVVGGSVSYESRLRFVEIPQAAAEKLAALLERNHMMQLGRPPASEQVIEIAAVTDDDVMPRIVASEFETESATATATAPPVLQSATQPEPVATSNASTMTCGVDVLRALYASVDNVRDFVREATREALQKNPGVLAGSPESVRDFVKTTRAAAMRRYAELNLGSLASSSEPAPEFELAYAAGQH